MQELYQVLSGSAMVPNRQLSQLPQSYTQPWDLLISAPAAQENVKELASIKIWTKKRFVCPTEP